MDMVISTKRTVLKSLSLEDIEKLFAYRSVPEVYAYHAWNPENIDEARSFIETHSIGSEARVGEWKQLGIYAKDGCELMGDCGFYRPCPEEAEIGYTVAPQYQGNGIATEIVRALAEFLQTETPTQRIIAKTDPDNIASIKVLERIGFEKISHLVKSIQIRGEWKDDLVFCLRTD